MVREHENSQAVKAAFLALLVHAGFFLVLLLSFNWKSEMPLQVSDVQLWDSLPMPKVQPLPPPKPEPKPEIKPEPKPAPPPPQPEPKAEIAVKKPQPKPDPKPKLEKKEPKPDQAELKKKEEALNKAKEKEILRKLQQMDDELAEKALNEDLKNLEAARNAAQAQQASAGEVDKFKALIRDRIYTNMNRTPCGNAVPEYRISLLPTGQMRDQPELVKSSGIPACDLAALHAIVAAAAQPFRMPSNPELFASFRDLRIPFKPEQ